MSLGKNHGLMWRQHTLRGNHVGSTCLERFHVDTIGNSLGRCAWKYSRSLCLKIFQVTVRLETIYGGVPGNTIDHYLCLERLPVDSRSLRLDRRYHRSL